jgi:hypothetical protein
VPVSQGYDPAGSSVDVKEPCGEWPLANGLTPGYMDRLDYVSMVSGEHSSHVAVEGLDCSSIPRQASGGSTYRITNQGVPLTRLYKTMTDPYMIHI